jgi:hypothetical protein
MPTARELLEQADALMRRNRAVGGADSGIPVLTDSVPEARAEPSRQGPSTRERSNATLRVQAPDSRDPRVDTGRDDRARAASPPTGDRQETTRTPDTAPDAEKPSAEPGTAPHDAEPPVLTDAVEEVAVDLAPLPAERAEGEPSLWLGPDTIDPALHSITGPAPDTVAVVPPVTLRTAAPPFEQIVGSGQAELPDPTVTRTFRAAGSATTPPPAGSTPPDATAVARASDDERWRALAEQISMQVLQRLDLFIDTGLKAQLAAHLEPIVVRAGTELVETINEHVGQLVRTYVAEAIEREIAQWRQDQR